MKTKHIILIVVLLLVLAAGITVICIGCQKDKAPAGNTPGTGTSQTPGGNADTTPGTTPDNPSNPANTDDLPAPSGGFELIDREELTDGSGTTPTTPTPKPTTPTPSTGPELDENGYWTYEYYISRSGEEQMAYYRTFPSMAAFNKWYNEAKAEYDRQHPKETIGPDGNIDLS